MKLISLATAVSITDWSERTFWRRFADGSLQREIGPHGKTMVSFDSIKPYLCVLVESDDVLLILNADNGSAEAQNDLALFLMAHQKFKNAIYWLEEAAKQDNADAMHWLGRFHIEGRAMPRDENIGIMWLAKSAACGHMISQAQMRLICEKAVA